MSSQGLSFVYHFPSPSSLTSFMARLNSPKAFPRALPTSGSLPGPKIINANTKIIKSSDVPILNTKTPPKVILNFPFADEKTIIRC